MSSCLEEIKTRRLNAQNQKAFATVNTLQKTFSDAVMKAFLKYAPDSALDELQNRQLHAFYSGNIILAAVSLFADYFDDLLPTAVGGFSPTYSLQVRDIR
jgi:hypothetical protein